MKNIEDMSVDELQLYKQVLELQAKLENSKNQPQGEIYFRVSQKGAVSVYGLQKGWPVTLPPAAWEALIARVPALQEFIKANQARLRAA